MFRKILVALDHSPTSQQVFEVASFVARATGADLLLLHVLSSEEEGSPLPIPPSLGDPHAVGGSEILLESWLREWQVYEGEGLKKLQAWAAEAHKAGMTVEFKQVRGSPGKMIGMLARSWGADLIVMGNRGHTGLSELFLGSVSNYVLHHAPCSVFIVKSR